LNTNQYAVPIELSCSKTKNKHFLDKKTTGRMPSSLLILPPSQVQTFFSTVLKRTQSELKGRQHYWIQTEPFLFKCNFDLPGPFPPIYYFTVEKTAHQD